jgi:hypothetical protein
VNARRRNSSSGSIGSFTRCSIAANAASITAAPASRPRISVLPQPSSLPRRSASTSITSALLKVTSPSQSMRVALGSRDSRMRRSVTAIAAMPIGTFRKNTHRQPKALVIAPPNSGPTATATPIVANARDARWMHNDMRAVCRFGGEGEAHFDDLGVGLYWVQPGRPMSLYHHEAEQEDFLILRGASRWRDRRRRSSEGARRRWRAALAGFAGRRSVTLMSGR